MLDQWCWVMRAMKFIGIFHSLKVLRRCEDLRTLAVASDGPVWCRKTSDIWCDLLCFVSKGCSLWISLWLWICLNLFFFVLWLSKLCVMQSYWAKLRETRVFNKGTWCYKTHELCQLSLMGTVAMLWDTTALVRFGQHLSTGFVQRLWMHSGMSMGSSRLDSLLNYMIGTKDCLLTNTFGSSGDISHHTLIPTAHWCLCKCHCRANKWCDQKKTFLSKKVQWFIF